MEVRFWGVRGSIAVSGSSFLHTGGNTACLELTHGGSRLILDGGTGLRALGDTLGSPTRAAILFSHVHWDHIQGVPFFGPAFHPDSELVIGGAARQSGGVKDALMAQMKPPTFPITLDSLRSKLGFVDLRPGQPWEYGPFRVTCLELPHPDGVLGYRIEAGGKSLVYATDVEHGEQILTGLPRFCEGADLLVHDAQYTDEEYRGVGTFSRRGWGHSSWRDALAVGKLADVGKVALFHHDPRRDDTGVAVIEHQAQAHYPAFAAREGQVVCL